MDKPKQRYEAYGYLEAGRDFRPFRLASQFERVPEWRVPLDAASSDRVERLAQSCLVISLHDHVSVRPEDPEEFADYRRQGREATPYEGLVASPLDVVFDGGPAAVGRHWPDRGWDWEDTVADLGIRQADWSHSGQVRVVRSLREIRASKNAGRVGLVLTLESASPIDRDLDRLDVLYGLGIRALGVVYTHRNRLGSGCGDPQDDGLTRFGGEAIRRMNQLGMLVDVSHAGDRTSLDAITTSTTPVVISHAGARAVWPTSRMKPDDVIRECAAAGGVIGIEAAPGSTLAGDPARHDIESVFAHFHHCLELVGLEHVTFGPDTHFGDHVAWNRKFNTSTGSNDTLKLSIPWVVGCENPREAWWNVIRRLVLEGFKDDEIRKLVGGNVMRVLRQSWR